MAGVDTEVYVKLESGQTVTLNALPSDTVSDLTKQVAQKGDIPKDRLKLKYQGKVLNPNHTVGFLGIRVETILKAEVVKVKSWTVRVALEDEDKVVPVQVQNVSPVHHVMTRLKEEVRLSKDGRKLLKLGARVLRNMEISLTDAGVTDNALLTLVIEPTEPPEPEMDDADKTEKVSGLDLAEVMGTFDAGSRPVDVVFSFDTTGSMYSCLSQVRAKLREACSRLVADIERLRIGIIAHGDYCDFNKYVLRTQDLTRDVDSLVSFVDSVPATGGGDSPECYEWALHKAQQMEWAEDSAKALVIIGDALPHGVNYTDQHINWHDELDVLRGMGVKVYGMQALNSPESTNFYKHIAEHTGGAYIKFSNFNVITEMFLAVCYREADAGAQPDGEDEVAGGSNQLAAFMDQLQEEGRLEGDVQEALQQVAQQAPAQPPVSDRYIAAPWWDPSLDWTTPQYTYDAATDSWSYLYTTPASSTSYTPPPSATHAPVALTRGQSIRRALGKLRPRSSANPSSKKSCSIM